MNSLESRFFDFNLYLVNTQAEDMSSKEILAKSTFTEMDKNGDGKVNVMLTI